MMGLEGCPTVKKQKVSDTLLILPIVQRLRRRAGLGVRMTLRVNEDLGSLYVNFRYIYFMALGPRVS